MSIDKTLDIERAIEAAVRALDREEAAQMGEPDPWRDIPPGSPVGDYQSFYDDRIACMEVALAAMKDAGYVMVPVEPTPEMLAAFHEACDENGQCLVKTGYRAMLSARPGNAQ